MGVLRDNNGYVRTIIPRLFSGNTHNETRNFFLFFTKEYFPKEITDKEKAGDDDGDGDEGEFVEGDGENAEHPEESEPECRIFFAYFARLPIEADIEVSSQCDEDER